MKSFFFFVFVLFAQLEGALIPITLDFAYTPAEHEKGLMQTSALKPNHGMLFLYSKPKKLSFWMYNTWIDLSIAFIDEHQIIREIYELKSYPEITDPSFFSAKGVSSSFEAQYALEMECYWFESHHVLPGDKVYWDPVSHQGYISTKH